MTEETNSSDDTDSNVRIIKKYPNRRVYDTSESKYIKIDDIREMVVSNIDFIVIDTQSKKDVTRSVILQIIIEQESESNPLFSNDNLKHFIRYSHTAQNQLFSDFLNQSLNYFNMQQEEFSSNIQEIFSQNPVENFSEISKKNVEMWQNFQQSFLDQFSEKK